MLHSDSAQLGIALVGGLGEELLVKAVGIPWLMHADTCSVSASCHKRIQTFQTQFTSMLGRVPLKVSEASHLPTCFSGAAALPGKLLSG